MFPKQLHVTARRLSSLALISCLLFSSFTVFAEPGTITTTPSTPPLTQTPSTEPTAITPSTDDIKNGEVTPVDAEEVTPPAVVEPTIPPATPPAPVPVQPAAPGIVLNTDGYPLVESFAANLPGDFTLNLLYQKYLTNYDYALPKSGVGIRTGPGGSFDFIRKPGTYEKMSLVDSVKGEMIAQYGSDLWYRIYWYDKSGIRTGYVYGPLIDVRHFDLARKIKEAKAVQADLAQAGTLGYVNNYKNKRGTPPKLPGGVNDSFGNDSSQSAPGYASLSNLKDFVYVQDGTLLLIIGKNAGYYHCRLPGKQTTYWVPQKYITISTSMKGATQYVVVDRKQQNSAVFQKTDSGWQLVSYQVVTTGARDQYRYPTPLGAFMAIEKKAKFLYLHDVTKEVDGYAPNVIRFSGGAYLHGVPVTFKKDAVTGKLVDPGEIEFLSTLGTVPRSHKCVRNYTSHAKFLHDWTKIGQTAVIVIE